MFCVGKKGVVTVMAIRAGRSLCGGQNYDLPVSTNTNVVNISRGMQTVCGGIIDRSVSPGSRSPCFDVFDKLYEVSCCCFFPLWEDLKKQSYIYTLFFELF